MTKDRKVVDVDDDEGLSARGEMAQDELVKADERDVGQQGGDGATLGNPLCRMDELAIPHVGVASMSSTMALK